MAKYREIPCKYYIAMGQCQKGREARRRCKFTVGIIVAETAGCVSDIEPVKKSL